jgi:hypothetical protein
MRSAQALLSGNTVVAQMHVNGHSNSSSWSAQRKLSFKRRSHTRMDFLRKINSNGTGTVVGEGIRTWERNWRRLLGSPTRAEDISIWSPRTCNTMDDPVLQPTKSP